MHGALCGGWCSFFVWGLLIHDSCVFCFALFCCCCRVFQRTPLHFACEAGSHECVKELFRAGAAANVSDQNARTPLHFGEKALLPDFALFF